jgi:hypothetical protein
VWFLLEIINYVKTMRIFRYRVWVIPFLFFLGSCHKIEHISPIPSISFTSFTIKDTTDILGNQAKGGKLSFFFEDGDGDVGLNPPDGILTDSTNLFLKLYRKIDGVMVLAKPGDPLYPSDYRIPYMVRVGQDKTLRGTISVTFIYLFYSPTDTIKYDFKIKDRALHESNTASTSEIVIGTNKVYTK